MSDLGAPFWKAVSLFLLAALVGVYILYEWYDESLYAKLADQETLIAEAEERLRGVEAERAALQETQAAVDARIAALQETHEAEKQQMTEAREALELEKAALKADLKALESTDAAMLAKEREIRAEILEEKASLAADFDDLVERCEVARGLNLSLQTKLDKVNAAIAKTTAEHQARIAELEAHLNERVRLARTTPMDAELLQTAQELGVLSAGSASRSEAGSPALAEELSKVQAQLTSVAQALEAAQTTQAESPSAVSDAELGPARARVAELEASLGAALARSVEADEAVAALLARYAALADLGGCYTEQGLSVSLDEQELRFASGQAELPPAERPSLDKMAELLVDQPALRVRIEGHTDNAGSETLNLELSEQRAEAVKLALVERGVGTDRVIAEGVGAARPIADNATSEGRSRNRRVEVYIEE